MKEFAVSIKALAEFLFRRGDIILKASKSPTAQEGQEGQKRVQSNRPANYQTEVAVEQSFCGNLCQWRLAGRADGFTPGTDQCTSEIEEIKTTYYSRQTLPATQQQLHFAQAKLYAALLVEQLNLANIRIKLSYWQPDAESEYSFSVTESNTVITHWFSNVVEAYTQWLDCYCKHLNKRDQSIRTLQFPFTKFRAGQRQLATSLFRHIRDESNGFYHAPTGIGKTTATLFPALKALSESHCQQIWYLTAKTSGSRSVNQTLDLLKMQTLNLKTIHLQSRTRTCFCKPGNSIERSECHFQQGFYDRLEQARKEFNELPYCSQEEVIALAKKYELCPHQFTHELIQWSDLVVADFNYVFDPYVRDMDNLKSIRQKTLLVDEAHNLPDRAREMYSESLSVETLKQLHRLIEDKALNRQLKKLIKLHKAIIRDDNSAIATIEKEKFIYQRIALTTVERLAEYEWLLYPEELFEAVQQLLRFAKRLDTIDNADRLLKDSFAEALKIFCTNPAQRIKTMADIFSSTHFFSGSLLPSEYFTHLLSTRIDTPFLQLQSPFLPNQQTMIGFPLNTRYHQRATSLPLLLDILQQVNTQKPGRYLVAFPSFEYMDNVVNFSKNQKAGLPISRQPRTNNEEEKIFFLQGFSRNPQFNFVVSGGSFAEGIDLPPTAKLSGVIVIGTSLAPPSPEKNAISDYFRSVRLNEFDYTFRFPGINKVIQTVGRLIRSEHDKGMVLLLDDRFLQKNYQAYFPRHWHIQATHSLEQLSALLKS